MEEENRIAKDIVESAIRVHRKLGPGLLESAYQAALAYLLIKKGYKVEKEKDQPVQFEEVKLDVGYRIDLLVNEKVVVELKTVDKLSKIHLAQTLTYLKLSKCRLGLLLNFNVLLMKDGIKRVINT
ncbi:GxxExxY protein [Gracilimonas halophila]|uniref:GxxExxY protein n=1 Tax=Gracilimonas halophila TaxID=1834464 RepID=A0ABW5JN38_9BACT